MAILQVALDFMILDRALRAAMEAVKGGADWLEAGTPLIKSAGMQAVRKLRKFGKPVVADLKTMDVGRVEVEMAAKSGASIITVLALADNETICDSIEAARKYGAKIMADLINHPDPVKRAKELEEMGVDYLCVHVGVDQQMRGLNPLDVLENVVKAVDIPVAAAGGLNSETVPEVVRRGAEVVIVGGAIIKAPDIEGATRRIKKAMESGRAEGTRLYRKYGLGEVREALERVSTSNLSDAMHRKNAIGGLVRFGEGKMIGPAVTVKTMDGDWAKPVEAIDVAKEGDVIVIDASPGNVAVWGELATWSCRVKGISGVVIFGAVRDADDIKKIGLPVYARRVVPHAGEPKGFGEIGVDLVVEGVRIRPGDWIVGDESGIVVVPKERLVEIANRALDVKEHEDRIREEIKRGSTLSVVMELREWEVER